MLSDEYAKEFKYVKLKCNFTVILIFVYIDHIQKCKWIFLLINDENSKYYTIYNYKLNYVVIFKLSFEN